LPLSFCLTLLVGGLRTRTLRKRDRNWSERYRCRKAGAKNLHAGAGLFPRLKLEHGQFSGGHLDDLLVWDALTVPGADVLCVTCANGELWNDI
jgi:hypothetical protein